MRSPERPFQREYLDEERPERPDVFSVWMMKGNRERLDAIKKLLEQSKDSTVINQIIEISYTILIGDTKMPVILGIVFKNKRNNSRSGIVEFE